MTRMEAGRPRTWRIVAFTTAALAGFAANSLLTRHAIDSHAIDATSFMSIRLISGAVTLACLAWMRGEPREGSIGSALALAGYALGFTLAYAHIPAGVGALLLFGSVQITMIAWGAWQGERHRWTDWLALALAMSGLWYLTAPGLTTRGLTSPDPLGSILMIAAGICWGIYSLRGRGAARPLAATAGNFVRTMPIAIVAWVLMLGQLQLSTRGVLMATLSGSLTSGIAYSLWYAALPLLSTWTAAIVQLCVPIVTAVAAAMLLSEPLTPRLLLSGAAILGGELWSVASSRPRPRP
jgi:drug/metabolite transporter (DMT)-like permease